MKKIKDREIYFTTIVANKWTTVFYDIPATIFLLIETLNWFVKKGKVKIYGFVIMKDHIHLLWEVLDKSKIEEIIISFKKYTGRIIRDYFKNFDGDYLLNFLTKRNDRIYQIWKLNSGNLKIESEDILQQKLNYIHENPSKGEYKSTQTPKDYLFSSAKAYWELESNFKFLSIWPQCEKFWIPGSRRPLAQEG